MVYTKIEDSIVHDHRNYVRHPEFLEPVVRMGEALQQYKKTNEDEALEFAIEVGEFIRRHLNFQTVPTELKIGVFELAGHAYQLRYDSKGALDDLNNVVECYERAARL